MNADEEIEAQLGAVFDELVELIGETKQAVWTASSSERRQTFDNLKAFVVEQVVMIDDAERRIGTRPPWVQSPTAHRARNIAAEAAGDAQRLVELLVGDLRRVVEDVRGRAATLEGEWQELLADIADNLERHIDAL
jgi:DNA-binding ferritin-like protein